MATNSFTAPQEGATLRSAPNEASYSEPVQILAYEAILQAHEQNGGRPAARWLSAVLSASHWASALFEASKKSRCSSSVMLSWSASVTCRAPAGGEPMPAR